MKRLLGAVVVLWLLAACSSHHATRTTSATGEGTSSTSTVLDQDTLVRRCLPQLTRAGYADGSEQTAEPLSTSTVVPAKPLVAHHAGDLVAFYARAGTSGRVGTVAWIRLDRLCRVPATDPRAEPGSDLLSKADVRPSQDRRVRDLQLCTEAPDDTGSYENSGVAETQVVAPDVRHARFLTEAWGPRDVGVQLLADRDDTLGVLCTFDVYGENGIEVVTPSRTIRYLQYVNGGVGQPDSYVAAGLVPSVGDEQRQPATTVAVTPPGRPTQRFPVHRTGLTGDEGVGSYAFVMRFPRETVTLGQQHAGVQLLDSAGGVLWSGRWDVGIEGH